MRVTALSYTPTYFIYTDSTEINHSMDKKKKKRAKSGKCKTKYL